MIEKIVKGILVLVIAFVIFCLGGIVRGRIDSYPTYPNAQVFVGDISSGNFCAVILNVPNHSLSVTNGIYSEEGFLTPNEVRVIYNVFGNKMRSVN